MLGLRGVGRAAMCGAGVIRSGAADAEVEGPFIAVSRAAVLTFVAAERLVVGGCPLVGRWTVLGARDMMRTFEDSIPGVSRYLSVYEGGGFPRNGCWLKSDVNLLNRHTRRGNRGICLQSP